VQTCKLVDVVEETGTGENLNENLANKKIGNLVVVEKIGREVSGCPGETGFFL
jgi:hypothetical protein